MLRDNLVGLIESMQISAGVDPLALTIQKQAASDDRPSCLENPRPERAESSLTENATSPFQAEPAHSQRNLPTPQNQSGSIVFAMNTVVLAVLLSIVQANPPVPRKTVGSTSNHQNSQQNKGTSPQTPSGQTGTANKSTTAEPNQQNTSTQAEKNTSNPESIIVRGRPDITVHKDDFDYFYIFGSLLLTLVTLVIAGLAWKQANVALLNVKAIVDSERAWVLLDSVKPENIDGKIFNAPRGMVVPLSVQFKNSGKTPAWVIAWCCKFVRADVAEFQGPIDYGSAKPGGDYAVAPNGGLFPVIPEGETPVISLSDIERIRHGQRSLVLYGLVRYRDVFVTKNQAIRETRFCVHLLVYANGPAAIWQLAGPDGANRCT